VKEIFTQVPQSKIATDDGSNLRIGEEVKNPIRFNPKDSSKTHDAGDEGN
jgi:hypothetical protein